MSKQIYIYIYTPESHFLKFISHPFERAGIYIYIIILLDVNLVCLILLQLELDGCIILVDS